MSAADIYCGVCGAQVGILLEGVHAAWHERLDHPANVTDLAKPKRDAEMIEVLKGVIRAQHAEAATLVRYAQHLTGCMPPGCHCGRDAAVAAHQRLAEGWT